MSFNIILFNQKDEAQFNIVYKKYYSAIRYYTLKNVAGTEDVAEDITTECFVAAWKKCADFETEEHIKSFLYLKSKRDSINWTDLEKRRRRKAEDIAYHTPIAEEMSLEEDNEAIGAEVIRLIEHQMNKLPAVAGKVLRMYYEGKSTEEITAITGAVAKTVLNQKNVSIHALKDIIARFMKPVLSIVLKDPTKKAEKENINPEYFAPREFGKGKKGKIKKLRKNTYKGFLNHDACGLYLAQQGIKSSWDFQKWKDAGKRPKFVPVQPDRTYYPWNGWELFLGVPNHWSDFMSYQAAKKWIRDVANPRGVYSGMALRKFVRNNPDLIPKNFPRYPYKVYTRTGDWVSWEDLMGSQVWDYEEAKKWVHENFTPKGILTVTNYVKNAKLIPITMPRANPKVYYMKYGQWVSEDDFFGRDSTNKNNKMKGLRKVKS